jgi:predicted phage-related endonuclease
MLPKPKSREWHDARRAGVGGSDANIIMGGDEKAILKLWEEKVGRSEPEDLSDVFRVQLGLVTEDFNADWFFKKTNLPVIARGEMVKGKIDFMRSTLDGQIPMPDGSTAVWEAKHGSGFDKLPEIVKRYQPQLHHNMIVLGCRKAYLSVILGNDWDYQEIDLDDEYAQQVIDAEREFWECVRLQIPPSNAPAIVEPPEATKAIDMTGNNEWAAAASEWLTCKNYASQFDKAADKLKKMVAADAKVAKGHGIKIARDKRRALRITEEEG